MIPTLMIEHAHAKINLALHITGQRPDGYHFLDSLVAFTSLSDRLEATMTMEDQGRFKIIGPFAQNTPNNHNNLVLQAQTAFHEHIKQPVHYNLNLTKNLPVSSGIGGGSADAAACLRLLSKLHQGVSSLIIENIAKKLGADILMCLHNVSCHVQGIGEKIQSISPLPNLGIVLGNPLKPVSTQAVFQKLSCKENSSLPPIPRDLSNIKTLIEYLNLTRNDLESPAMEIEPAIIAIKNSLSNISPLFTRMSGSGATCFALFSTPEEAEKHAKSLQKHHQEWWFRHGILLNG